MGDAEYEITHQEPAFEVRSVPIDGDFFRSFANMLDEVGTEAIANRPDGRYLIEKIGDAVKSLHGVLRAVEEDR